MNRYHYKLSVLKDGDWITTEHTEHPTEQLDKLKEQGFTIWRLEVTRRSK